MRAKGIKNKPKIKVEEIIQPVIEQPKEIEQPEIIQTKEMEKELIEDLDDIFGMDDEIDIDDIIAGETVEHINKINDILDEGNDMATTTNKIRNFITDSSNSVGTIENLPQQSHKETHQSIGNRLFDSEIGRFCKYLITSHLITEDKETFLLKFKYYLLKENVELSALTPRRLSKFIREYQSYDLQEVLRIISSIK